MVIQAFRNKIIRAIVLIFSGIPLWFYLTNDRGGDRHSELPEAQLKRADSPTPAQSHGKYDESIASRDVHKKPNEDSSPVQPPRKAVDVYRIAKLPQDPFPELKAYQKIFADIVSDSSSDEEMRGEVGVRLRFTPDLNTKLIDLTTNRLLGLTEDAQRSLAKIIVEDADKKIYFQNGVMFGELSTKLTDSRLPICIATFASPSDGLGSEVAAESLVIGKIAHPVKPHSRFVGVRLLEAFHGRRQQYYIKSIDCGLMSDDENSELYKQLELRHLLATMGIWLW